MLSDLQKHTKDDFGDDDSIGDIDDDDDDEADDGDDGVGRDANDKSHLLAKFFLLPQHRSNPYKNGHRR